MSWSFRKRDAAAFTSRFLDEAGIRPGDTVLDFGCGPGSFSVAAARLTGPSGRVYACDIQPLAASFIQRKAAEAGVANVAFLCAGRDTGLAAESVDVVLLYDVLHMLSEPAAVLTELSRILRPGGLLSVSDHHMEEVRIRSVVEEEPGFVFERPGAVTLLFARRP
jgi:ubiquinone/menaquinone biosynthesis C-methylase UbiE